MALGESCPFAVKCDEKEANLYLGFTGHCTFGSLTAEIPLRMIAKDLVVKIL